MNKQFQYLIMTLFTLTHVFCGLPQKEHRYNRFLLGSSCEVKFYYIGEQKAEEIIDVIDLELTRLDSLLSYFSENSLVTEMNRASRARVSSDVVYLVSLADSISRLTDGYFDISVAPCLELWGFYKGELEIPETTEIVAAKRLVNYRRIKMSSDSIIISPGMKIDLGGIAQGYAADRVAMILRQRHVKSAIINIGGEVITIGKSPNNKPWRVGIRNPRGEGIIEVLELTDMAVSTSGDYEKFFMIDDRRYPHIINPKTGFPATDFASVTIIAKDGAFADGIATAVATMGPKNGSKFLDSLRIQGIIYYEENGHLKRLEIK